MTVSSKKSKDVLSLVTSTVLLFSHDAGLQKIYDITIQYNKHVNYDNIEVESESENFQVSRKK